MLDPYLVDTSSLFFRIHLSILSSDIWKKSVCPRVFIVQTRLRLPERVRPRLDLYDSNFAALITRSGMALNTRVYRLKRRVCFRPCIALP